MLQFYFLKENINNFTELSENFYVDKSFQNLEALQNCIRNLYAGPEA